MADDGMTMNGGDGIMAGHLAGPLGEPSQRDYLVTLRKGLVEAIAPDLRSDRARELLGMALLLFDHLIIRSGADAAAAGERRERLDAMSRALSADADAADLEDRIARVVLAGDDREATAQVRAGLIAERDYLACIAALEQDAAAAMGAKAERPFDEARVAAYLSDRCGGPVEVVSMGTPIGGFSKDVFVLLLAGDARPADRIVIRRDLPDGPLQGSVREEYDVLRVAGRCGVPVATPLWLEQDPAVFGGPAICLAFVEGAPAANARAEIAPATAAAAFRMLARIAARIHSIDPIATGLLPPGATAAQPHILALLDAFERQWKSRRAAGNMVLATGFAWMRANLPADPVPAAIVHGDCSLRNLMVHAGAPTALLDWETWHFGDPAEDLAYVRDEVESFMPWAEFIAEYRAAGGPEIPEARLRYWSIWRELRGSITSISMLDSVPRGSADIRAAFGGLYFTRILLAKLADRLQELLGS